jgi:hypothetical protein
VLAAVGERSEWQRQREDREDDDPAAEELWAMH